MTTEVLEYLMPTNWQKMDAEMAIKLLNDEKMENYVFKILGLKNLFF